MLVIEHNDAKYWADLVEEHLDKAIALAKELEKTANANDDHVMSLDLFKLTTMLMGIKSRNSHVQLDLTHVSASIDKLPVYYRTI